MNIDQKEKEKQKQKEKEKVKRLSQFEWFEIQTKVRQTVFDIMQPFQKRQIEEFSKLHQMRKNISFHDDTLKQHAFLLKGNDEQSPPLYVRALQNQITEIRSKVTNLEHTNAETKQNFRVKSQYFEEKVQKFNHLMSQFQRLKRERISDKQQMLEFLNKQIQSLTTTIANHQIQTTTTISNIKSKQFQVDQQILDAQNKIRQYQTSFRNFNTGMESLKREFKHMSQKQFQDHKYTQQIDLRLNIYETDKELSKKFMGVVDEIYNKMGFITNYIDKYLPLFVQAQLSDTLNSFIPDRQKIALCLYQERAFQNFNKIIISNQGEGLSQNIKRYVNVVEQIIIRNKKYVIKLKVSRKARLGDQQYDIHEMEENNNDDKRIVTDSQVPQDKIKEIVSVEWRQFSESLNMMLKTNSEAIRSQIQQFQHTQQMKYLRFSDQIQQLEVKLGKIQVNSQLSNAHLENELKNNQTTISELKKQLLEQSNISRDIVNFSSIINHVVIQDQLDRQGIALFGLKETPKGMKQKNQSTVGLDGKCLGCSGYPASTLSAFKMACLAYNPSSITVDGQIFRRQQILDLSTRLLQSIKYKFQGTQKPNKEEEGKEKLKTTSRNQRRQSLDKTATLNGFNTLQVQSKQVLPSIKSKKSHQTSLRKRSVHQSFYNPPNSQNI